jgi:hypothetical protein
MTLHFLPTLKTSPTPILVETRNNRNRHNIDCRVSQAIRAEPGIRHQLFSFSLEEVPPKQPTIIFFLLAFAEATIMETDSSLFALEGSSFEESCSTFMHSWSLRLPLFFPHKPNLILMAAI